MSDQIPTDPQDRVRDTLTALRSDAERAPLASTADVRRRGQARTRHQAVAGLAAAVVVVVAIVTGGALVNGSTKADRPLPAGPRIADDPFVPPAHFFRSYPSYAVASSSTSLREGAASCLSGLTVPGATATKVRTYSGVAELDNGTVDLTATQAVWQLPSEAAGATAAADVDETLSSCAAELVDDTTGGAHIDPSLGQFIQSDLALPIDGVRANESLLLVRDKDLVSVLALPVVGKQLQTTDEEIEALLKEMRSTLSNGPRQRPVDELTTDAFLRDADVDTIGAYENIQRSTDPVSYQPKLVCIEGPTTWGATRTLTQLYFSDLDATFYEHVLHYPSAAAAAAGVETVLSQLGSCEVDKQHPKRITQRGPEPVADAPDSVRASWLSTAQADSEVYYYELGIRRVGNVVAVLEWSSMGNPEKQDGWVWTADRLNLAAQRATR
jgi:hypothetical protein